VDPEVDHPEWFVTRWITGGPGGTGLGAGAGAGIGAGTGIALIAEPGHVNSYLVVGSRRALLFDSGMGMRPMLPVLERLTGLPLIVVNSHDHFDHRGGNQELAPHVVDIAVHPAGLDGHAAAPADFYPTYRRAASRAAELFERFAELDRSGPFTLTPDQHPRPLPPLDRWRIPAVAPTRGLADGESIELGDRTVTVLHTPGHSPDSLCLWDPETRTLLSGDTVLSAAYWAHQPGADVAVFARSLGRLAELPLHRVLVAHNLRAELDVYAVHRAARAMYAVAEGHTRPRPGVDALDRPVDRHELHGITVFTAPATAAPATAAPATAGPDIAGPDAPVTTAPDTGVGR
jgi:glyoxylase-like metal-dependent hydrolase (beta-lactamase superfamily II)